MANDDWPVQAAMQEYLLDAIEPESAGRRVFRFVAQENTEPYALTVVRLPESVMTMGRIRLQRAMTIWRECTESDVWPLYPPHEHIAQYPGWFENRLMEREENMSRREPMLTDLSGG